MPMVVSLGSINADFAVRADAAPSGAGSVLARDLLRTSGGKAANVALLSRRLGVDAVLLACVGDDDLAEQALRGPRAAGVDIARVRRVPGHTGYSSIVVPPDGDKTIVLAPNANDAWAEHADGVRDDVAAAPEGAIVVADHEVPVQLVEAALRAARRRGLVTVLDPAPTDRVVDELLGLVDHLTPDHREAEQLTGVGTDDVDGAVRAAEDLRSRGAGVVHVKLAEGGCATATAEGVTVVRAPSDVDIVDLTGAGDAFAGGLAWALARGDDAVAAAHVAVAAASCAVGTYGSQESYPGPDELAAMVGRVRAATAAGAAGG